MTITNGCIVNDLRSPGRITKDAKFENRVMQYLALLNIVHYKKWKFEIEIVDKKKPAVLRALFHADGKMWSTRKYLLSTHATRSEIVQTMFLCVKVAEEHEMRENFTYRLKPIFGPHYDVDKLFELCNEPDHLDVREG